MVKFQKFVLIGLLSSMYFQVDSHITPKISSAVRESNVTVLESELKINKLTKEDAKELLEVAQEIEKLKQAKLSRAPRKMKQVMKIMKSAKSYLVAGLHVGTGIASLITSVGLFLGKLETEDDLKLAKIFIPATGVSSLILGLYARRLFNRMNRFKTKQDQYVDAMATRQILTRLSAAKE